jgi:hypothetical protein
VKGSLSCPRYSNIDNNIAASLNSFSASPSNVVWTRSHEGGSTISCKYKK